MIYRIGAESSILSSFFCNPRILIIFFYSNELTFLELFEYNWKYSISSQDIRIWLPSQSWKRFLRVEVALNKVFVFVLVQGIPEHYVALLGTSSAVILARTN